MSVAFETPDWSQDICEICDQLVDTTKPHPCSMKRALQLRAKRMGPKFTPFACNTLGVVEEKVDADEAEAWAL